MARFGIHPSSEGDFLRLPDVTGPFLSYTVGEVGNKNLDKKETEK
jgi:hypothetical protein